MNLPIKLLILVGYNNYFNRIHRSVYTNYTDFISHIDSLNNQTIVNFISYYNFEVQDFDYNDGLNTEVVIGSSQQQEIIPGGTTPLNWRDHMPDYLIVHHYKPTKIITKETDIDSRWFVINCTKIRGGQYKLTLKRDVISDFLVDSSSGFTSRGIDVPALIKKGYVENDNPLILNTENITVNQIKKNEILLQDNSKTPWIVGYMAKGTGVEESVDVQIPDEKFSNYTTIEAIAEDLQISANDLKAVLRPNDEESPSYFLDINTEVVGWVNNPNNNNTEWKMRTGSYNNLQAFNKSYEPTLLSHDPVSDCFAIINQAYKPDAGPWTEAVNEGISSIRNNWEIITGHPLLVRKVYERLHSMSKTNGKSILLMNGTYYYICEKNTTSQGGNRYDVNKEGTIFEAICSNYISKQNALNPYANVRPLTGGKIFVYCNEIKSTFYLERITDTNVIPGAKLEMSSTRYGLVSEPYDMFAIPLDSIKAINNDVEYNLQGDYAQKLAVQMAKKLDKVIYDIQLLPYCPLQDSNTETILQDNTLILDNLREGYDYDWIVEDSATIERKVSTSLVLPRPLPSPGTRTNHFQIITSIENSTITSVTYEIIANEDKIISGLPLTVSHNAALGDRTIISTSSITWDWTGNEEDIPVIQFTITSTQADYPTSIIIYPKTNSGAFTIDKRLELTDDMKIENICNNYRLVSPNYQGSFDFNVAKNGGQVDGFTVDFTYKPYTPYIRVAPVFNPQWLYGGDWDDCRGLICGGDFSIGLMNSAWESYQLNNKNYQNIFNREIQNLDVNQQLQMQKMTFQDIMAIPTGSLGGAKTGATMSKGNVYATIAGGVLGAGATAAGAVLDNYWLNKEQVEQRQYAIDKYKLSLGNIQALPYTLTKIGAFNINSKIWPFLEYYTCTDEEKEVVKQKIHYEGMNLGVVGNIADYIDYVNGSFIQADLIRTFNSTWYVDHYLDPSEDEEYYVEDGMFNTEAIANAIYNEFTRGVFWYGDGDADKFNKEIWYEEDSDDEGE